MADPTLYLFDGFNLLHSGGFESPAALRDLLAGWVATKGARGVLVFDGHGDDEAHGPLQVRWAPDADALIERLAAEYRSGEQVAVVSSDEAVRGTSGAQVQKMSSRMFWPTARRHVDPRVRPPDQPIPHILASSGKRSPGRS
jgi:predicted RNA-binding protein with PIN domain